MSIVERVRRKLAGDPRLARILHGGASGVLGRGLGLLVGAISLPLTVRYLGRLEYGVWVTISSSIAMLSVLDLGIANTLTNHISEAYATDDRQAARHAFSTAFWLTVAVSLVLGAAFAWVWYRIDWGQLLSLPDAAVAGRARSAVAIAVGYFLLSMPLSLGNRVLTGYQEVHLSNYFSMFNNVMGLVAVICAMLVHGNLVSLMLWYCATMTLGSIFMNLWLTAHHRPWIRPSPLAFRTSVASSFFRQGLFFFVMQLTTLVVFNCDNLVITHYLGAAEVTPYSIAWRLSSYAALLQSLFVPSSCPAFTEAYLKREMDWMGRTYRSMANKTQLAVFAAAVGIGVFGRPFIRVWAGPAAVPSQTLLWTMALWAVLVAVTTNQALLLTATGRLKVAATVAVLAAVANLWLSIMLVQRIGSEGAILATIFSFAFFMVVPQEWEVRRVLRGAFLETRKPSALRPLDQPVES